MEIQLGPSMPIEVAVKGAATMFPEQFTEIRRVGLGGSDSGVVCGVNPYPDGTIANLIQSKLPHAPTLEEIAIGQNRNVRAGKDMEPIIIEKVSGYFPDWHLFKPQDMYRFKEFPYLTMNFDAVGFCNDAHGYFPDEIKLVSIYGSAHYDRTKALFNEATGFYNEPIDITKEPMNIIAKASHYGIPPYYYTQVQQEIFALGATHGYLTAFFEKEWMISVFMIHADQAVFDEIAVKGYKIWQEIEQLKRLSNAASSSVFAASVDGESSEVSDGHY